MFMIFLQVYNVLTIFIVNTQGKVNYIWGGIYNCFCTLISSLLPLFI